MWKRKYNKIGELFGEIGWLVGNLDDSGKYDLKFLEVADRMSEFSWTWRWWINRQRESVILKPMGELVGLFQDGVGDRCKELLGGLDSRKVDPWVAAWYNGGKLSEYKDSVAGIKTDDAEIGVPGLVAYCKQVVASQDGFQVLSGDCFSKSSPI